MFVARACIDMLLRSEDFGKAEYILNSFRQQLGSTPLLNLVELLIDGLRANDFEFIKKMVTVDYLPSVRRDGLLFDKIDKVCLKYLDQSFTPVNPMQAMMANMFGGGKKK